MRKFYTLIAVMIACYGFGQCPFPVQLINKGNNCLQTDTLAIRSSNIISSITWLNNNIPDTTLSALTIAMPPQNAVTVAGGNGPGVLLNQFNSPSSVFLDGNGNIYVADRSNYRVLKFPFNSASTTSGQIVAGGNGPGKANNQLQPNAVFVDNGGFLYVADYSNNRVLKFAAGSTAETAGTVVAGGNGAGTAANQLTNAVSLFVDNNGYLFVLDAFNDRVQKFPPNSASTTSAVTVAGGNDYGNKANQFNGPSSIFIDNAGNIYVADAANNRIQRFPSNSTSATNGVTIAGGNGFGHAPDQLATPASIWGDDKGNIYVADINNERIQKFPPGSTSFTIGNTVAGGNGQGNAPNQFSGPNALWGDNNGSLYVCDVGNNRIQKFTTTPVRQYIIDTNLLPRTAGSYTAIVSDTSGCSVTTSEAVINPLAIPAIHITSSLSNIVPCAQSKADVSFTATSVNSGALPVYQWQINGKYVGSNTSSFTTSVATKDVVSCLLISNAACAVPVKVESNKIAVSFASKPIVNLKSKGRLCAGIDTLIVNSDNDISAIAWYNGMLLDTLIKAEKIVDGTRIDTTYRPSVAGNYKAIITDTAGCSDTSVAVTIQASIKPDINITSDKTKICKGDSIRFMATSVNGGNAPVFEWQVNGFIDGTNSSQFSHSFQDNAIIRCIIYGDTTGCYDNDTSNTIIPDVKPLPVFEHITDKSISLGQSIILSIPTAANIISYTWQPNATLLNSFAASPVATPAITTTYRLRVLSADSCVASDSIKIIVSSPVIIPNAFTPNGDGLNDRWFILGGKADDRVLKLVVFNRWGQKVFYATDLLTGIAKYGWDGTYIGNPQPQGVYMYEAIIISADKTKRIYNGVLTLIR